MASLTRRTPKPSCCSRGRRPGGGLLTICPAVTLRRSEGRAPKGYIEAPAPGDRMRRLLLDLTAASFILLLMGGCADPTPANWERFVTAFLDSSYAADPAFAVALGKHEFDGRLPDLSDAGLKREITRLH